MTTLTDAQIYEAAKQAVTVSRKMYGRYAWDRIGADYREAVLARQIIMHASVSDDVSVRTALIVLNAAIVYANTLA
jgi:hypothetical protein